MSSKTDIHFHIKLIWKGVKTEEEYCVDFSFDNYLPSKIEMELSAEQSPKISEFMDALVRAKDIAPFFEITQVTTDGYENINLSNSRVIRMIYSSSAVNKLSLEISEAKFDYIRYKRKTNIKEHFFFLSKAAQILAPTISTKFDAKGIWQDNTEREIIHFKEHQLELANEYFPIQHFSENSEQLTLQRAPRLKILTEEKDFDEIEKTGKIVCLLMSFYLADEVDYSTYIFNQPDRLSVCVRIVNLERNRKSTHRLTTNYKSFKDFVESIQDTQQIYEEYDWWEKNIQKLITASRLDGESKFMLLYNILEQSFLYLKTIGKISTNSSKTYFPGIEKKMKDVKALARGLVESIKLYIPSTGTEDIKNFEQQNQKISFLRQIITDNSKNVSRDKIQLLLKKLSIEDKDFDNELVKKIVALRDDIIHGNKDIPIVALTPINTELFKLANLVLLKLLNINNELSVYLTRT